MAYIKETFTAPGVIEIKKYHSWRWGGKKTRGANEKATSKKQKKINSEKSRMHLARLIATNFKRGDMRIDLTYAGEEPTPEEADRRIGNFINRAKRFYKKQGEIFKWILATENKEHRIHHHLLINFVKGKVEEDDIAKLWPYAKLNYRSTRKFDGGIEDAKRLAWYITKETDKTIGEEGSIQKKRYRCSRNLMKPDVKKEVIYSRNWTDKPKPKKGYTICDSYNGYTEEGFPFQYILQVKDMTKEDTDCWARKIAKWEAKQKRKQGKRKGKKIVKSKSRRGPPAERNHDE